MSEWTHIITNLTSNELEADENGNEDSANGSPIGSPRTDLVTFDPKPGLNWVVISIYCKADGADTIAKLRPYFEDLKQSEILALLGVSPSQFYGKGDLIYRKDKSGNAVKTPDGQTEKYVLAPVYVGNYRVKFALEACETGCDLAIVIDRVAVEQLPTYQENS